MESVLIVDDEKDNLEALRRLLRQEFQITTTDSGIEALKLIRAQEFAVIVSDQRMPEITGVDLLEKAKLIRPAMTRILLTGYTDIESVIGAINRGSIYRYVAKPWDPDDLKITLRQAVESYRLKTDLDAKNRALLASNTELQTALDQLRLLDKAKARFLSLVSHELNTPLTSVAAFVGLLNEDHGFSPDIQRAVTSLSSASDRLAEIIDDVLTYVRLEADANWALSEFDWEKETVAAIAQLEAAREKKQVALSIQGKAGVRSPSAAEKTRLAISKLLAEAIGRSPKNEKVTVLFAAGEKELAFKVSWKGEPLPAAAFEAFEATGDEMKHHRNLALGLAIAKLIVEKQGGRLTSEGSASAKTATLVMTIPT
jgi:two-component system, sensor histidine kinase and response regulator